MRLTTSIGNSTPNLIKLKGYYRLDIEGPGHV